MGCDWVYFQCFCGIKIKWKYLPYFLLSRLKVKQFKLSNEDLPTFESSQSQDLDQNPKKKTKKLFFNLPDDCQILIFQFLSLKDINNFGLCCKRIYLNSIKDVVWNSYLEGTFDEDPRLRKMWTQEKLKKEKKRDISLCILNYPIPIIHQKMDKDLIHENIFFLDKTKQKE